MSAELKAALQQARTYAAKTIQATDPVYAKNIMVGRCDDVWAVQAVLASLQAPCLGNTIRCSKCGNPDSQMCDCSLPGPSAQPVPSGEWVLVPREPTDEAWKLALSECGLFVSVEAVYRMRSVWHAMISAIPDQMVVVPREPTKAMLEASQAALKIGIDATPEADRNWRGRKTYRGPGVGYAIPPDTKARWRWAAMLSAAPSLPDSRQELGSVGRENVLPRQADKGSAMPSEGATVRKAIAEYLRFRDESIGPMEYGPDSDDERLASADEILKLVADECRNRVLWPEWHDEFWPSEHADCPATPQQASKGGSEQKNCLDSQTSGGE